MVDKTYLYEQVSQRLLEQRRNLNAPLRLPDEYQLAEQYNVGRETIRRAMKLLEQQKAITRSPRVGTYLQPHRSAADALKGKHVGLMPPWWADSASAWFTSTLFEGVSRWADEHGAMISVLHSQSSEDEQVSAASQHALRERLAERNLTGLIWLHPQRWQQPLLEAAASELPTIVLGRHSQTDLCHITPDYEHAARLIDEHLVKHGHTRYVVVGKNAMEPFTATWIHAFEKVQQKRGRRFNERREFLDLSSFETRDLGRLMLEFHQPAHPDMHAYVLMNSSLLSDLLADEQVRERAHRDLSLVTWDFGKYPIDAYWPGRQVSHVACDWVQMGRTAMKVLAKLVADGNPPAITKLPVTFKPGNTVYPVEQNS